MLNVGAEADVSKGSEGKRGSGKKKGNRSESQWGTPFMAGDTELL